jgi:hypothetical protein
MSSTVMGKATSLRLRIFQVVWIILALASVGKFVMSEIVFAQGASQVCTASLLDCHNRQQLTAQDITSLHADGITIGLWVIYNIAFRSVIAAVFCVVSLAIYAFKRADPAALITSLFLILFGTLGGFASFLAERYPEYRFWFGLIQFPAFISLPLFFFSFPNGRIVPRGMWAIIVLWSLYFLSDFLLPGIDKNSPWFVVLVPVVWLTMWVGGLTAQVYRFLRVSNAEERRQTKWVVYAITILVVFILILFLLPPFNQLSDSSALFSLEQMLLLGITNLLVCLIPVSIGIAVLRSRLWDIDLVIRRTLIYAVLTVLLGLLYYGGVVVVQSILTADRGQPSAVAIVVTTLAIAALFTPLRKRIQNFIDWRFYRRKYDAEKALEAFATTARSETNLEQLSTSLTNTVQEALQPDQVSLWLKPTRD